MDMNCRKCNEPWDWFHIRDEVLAPDGKDDRLYEKMTKGGGFVRDYTNTTGQPSTWTMANDKKANWQFAPGPYILQCPACIGKDIELSEADKEKAAIMSAMADILGDDIDGFMAEMEDLEYLL